jgi:hypothetical protein
MHFLFYLLILKLGSKIKKWKNEKMKKLTGLETQQFLKIYIQIKSGLSKFKRKKKIKKKIILLIFFIYIHHYPKNIIISTIFNISESSVTNYFNFVLEILYKNYKNLNNLNFKEFKLIGSKKIVMVIDGTEQKVSCPQNLGLSKAIYSGKKSVHSFTKLVGISPITNKIIYITKSYGGSHSDQQLFNIKENNLDKILEEDEFIAGDLGFSGKCFLTKFKHPKNKSQENFNIDFQSTRIKIENIFAFLKKNEILN